MQAATRWRWYLAAAMRCQRPTQSTLATPGHAQATGAKASASAVAAVPSKKTIVCNTTAGIFAALNTTALAGGGGTILLEKGTYNVGCRSIDLPPEVTCRG